MKREHRLRYIIREGFKDIFYIWKEEFRNVFKDTGAIVFFFVVPLVYPVLYSFIYNNETVRNSKMVVVDHSDSFLSREFIRKVDGTADVQVVGVMGDMEAAKRMLDEKKAYAILYFPGDFSKKLNRGEQATISLYTDMSALLFYKAFLTVTTEVSLEMAKELATRNNPASTNKLQDITVDPIPYQNIGLFNSQTGFASFLVPAILILVIQQTLILGIGLLGGTAREKNRFHTLVPMSRYFHGTFRIVLGKGLTYLMMYAIICIWVFAIVPRLFGLPQVGSPLDVLLFLLPYLFACIFFSMTLSGIMTTRESPIMVMVFTSVILVFISGVSWPKESIPLFWRIIGEVFPSTAGIQGFVRINTDAATLYEVRREYHTLWVQTGLYFITTCLVYRCQIRQSEKRMLVEYETLKERRAAK
ncbi:MAG: ABC transporter permease [Tannerellaceae bacterium]|nr:ABC transporter permease [Tannerellaceae bacterium]MCD8263108.1 ABC transporter permease [Tannerellaceae bacterium]